MEFLKSVSRMSPACGSSQEGIQIPSEQKRTSHAGPVRGSNPAQHFNAAKECAADAFRRLSHQK
ncbi:MAG: hypothetical protein IOC96_18185 [Rhodobacter sp.]|nr:hypothetical protein [Rhodobacter sp.]